MLPQHWTDDIFSFSGRANRAPFWCLNLICLLALVVVAGFAYAIGLPPIVFWVLVGLGWLALMIIGIAVTVRRLHDRDKSGHWAWLFFLGPNALGGLAQSSGDAAIVLVLSLLSFAILIWYLVECGFLRGTPGTNRFGPNPIGH